MTMTALITVMVPPIRNAMIKFGRLIGLSVFLSFITVGKIQKAFLSVSSRVAAKSVTAKFYTAFYYFQS